MKLKLMVIVTVFLVAVSGVYAELHERGGGLIYDDVLDVKWSQDANYAQTSGYPDPEKTLFVLLESVGTGCNQSNKKKIII
jgi:hypothetical protein